MKLKEVPRRAIAWRASYRIISSRIPPVGVFDDIADPADLDALYALEGLTNQRLRDELGQVELVPKGRRIAGPGTTVVMAAFTHRNPSGSRFSDGSYGVYYAAHDMDSAIAETVHHRERFLAATDEAPTTLEMRCFVAPIKAVLHDIRGGWRAQHDPGSYAASQAMARQLRAADSNGIVYDSVRRPGGHCAAVFYPDLIGPAQQGAALFYKWDGQRITTVVVANQVIER